MTLVEEILAIYAARGAGAYFGERVSMTEHGLQAAHFAQAEDAPSHSSSPALLHDVDTSEEVPDSLEDWRTDAHHEEVGARWLSQRFHPEVCEAVRLARAGKALPVRHRCGLLRHAQSPRYTPWCCGVARWPRTRSRASDEPYHREVVRVRRWDDQGKVAGLQTAALHDYARMIETLAPPGSDRQRPRALGPAAAVHHAGPFMSARDLHEY